MERSTGTEVAAAVVELKQRLLLMLVLVPKLEAVRLAVDWLPPASQQPRHYPRHWQQQKVGMKTSQPAAVAEGLVESAAVAVAVVAAHQGCTYRAAVVGKVVVERDPGAVNPFLARIAMLGESAAD